MNKIITKTYAWMFVGLLVSFITGYYVSTNANMLYNIFATNMYWILAIVEIAVVIILSARLNKMSSMTAKTLFILYSFLTGLTLSVIFVAYRLDSIVFVFGITSLMFLIMSLIGRFTKLNLTKLSTFLLMGIIAILIASIINVFIGSETFDLGITIISIIIFVVYIAYDTQKIKYIAESVEEERASILCALELYLDFINLFLDLIKLFGKSRD